MKDALQHKTSLEEEFKKLKSELSKIGIENPYDPAEWDIKAPEMDIMNADENEAADRTEEIHVNSIILDELSVRYANISRALQKIESGTYGTCEVCSEQIDEDRLTANPAARTCKKHLDQETNLEK